MVIPLPLYCNPTSSTNCHNDNNLNIKRTFIYQWQGCVDTEFGLREGELLDENQDQAGRRRIGRKLKNSIEEREGHQGQRESNEAQLSACTQSNLGEVVQQS